LIVVDASALTDFLLGRREALDAFDEELADREQQPFHAPELVEPETLNALRRLVSAGHVSDRRASEAVADLANTRLICYPHAPLRERVWQLRSELTAYDATYLALAEALDEGVLLTCDAGLADRGRASLGEARVRLVG
jgi:predicted nucleic acid-binding protein